MTFLGLGILGYGILIVSTGIVPRAMGWLGIVSGVLLSVGVWLPRIDEGLYFIWVLLALPYALWQLGLGIWLLARRTVGWTPPKRILSGIPGTVMSMSTRSGSRGT